MPCWTPGRPESTREPHASSPPRPPSRLEPARTAIGFAGTLPCRLPAGRALRTGPMHDLHPLLADQLARLSLGTDVPPTDPRAWQGLLGSVGRTYADHEQQR